MAIGELQHRRGNTSALLGITPKDGEIFVNTDTYKIWVGDGATAGGILQDGNVIKFITATTYTLLATDAGKLLVLNNSSGIAVSAPAPAALYADQDRFSVLNVGTGTVTITVTGASINGSPTLLIDQYGGAVISTDASDYYALLCASPSGGGSTFTALTKTSNYTLLTTDSGKEIDNIGASAAIILQLPAAARGLIYTATVYASHSITLQTAGSELIAFGNNNSAAGGYLRSDEPFSTLTWKAHGSGQWVTKSSSGNWNVDA